MNPLRYFSKLESDLVRTDRFEGTSTIIQPQDIGEFTLTSILGTVTAQPSDFVGPVLISRNRTASCNVYCMFAVTRPVDGTLVDRRNLKFGDSFVLILNTQEFLNRVSSAMKTAGLSCKGGLVEYYDCEKHSGETGPFRKPSTFQYQSEFRLIVYPGSSDPVRLNVGSLVDITSEVLPLSDVNKHLDFSTESARKAGLKW